MKNDNFKIYFFSSTHWDREWYLPFQGFRHRLVSAVNEIIETLENDPGFKVFHFDGQTIVLEDFMEIEPGKRDRLARLISDKRLVVGPWYVMPDEFLLSGESLIRNLMEGHRTARAWGAEPWKYGYICDIFGHIAQMPQIFNGFGIRSALLGRGTNEHTTPAHFIWKAPDGSECVTFKLADKNGYGAFFIEVVGYRNKYKDIDELHQRMRKYIDHERERSGIPVVLAMDGFDHASIHVETPKYIEILKELYPQAEIRHVNLEEMGSELKPYRVQMPVKTGEINETAKMQGGYIHLITHTLSSRYPIKKANDECQALLEKWVEPLTAVAELKGFSVQRTYVDLAWRFLLQNHPHDSICGCSIDQVHKDMAYRFDQCRMISEQVVDEIILHENKRLTVDPDSQELVLQLWNPLPFARKEVVTVGIDFPKGYKSQYQEPFGYEAKNSFKILDGHGHELPYGLVGIKRDYRIKKHNRFAETADVHTVSFEAEAPAMGYSEYRIVPFENASRYLSGLSSAENEAENEYLKLKINNDGTIRIYDKLSGGIYDGLASYVDDGEIGDGWYHANPVEDSAVSSSGWECVIERIENGPSRTVFRVNGFMKVPESMDYHTHGIRRSRNTVTMKISSLIGLSKGARDVDVETTVSNTARDHRLRLRLPTGIATPTYFADQPFAFVERKTGVNLQTQDWAECDVPEKQMGGIVGKRAGDGAGLAFVSACGLHECAAMDDAHGTVLVTLFRSFVRTVGTNGEEGGQILGDLKFTYRLAPLLHDTSYADLTRLKDCMQATIKPAVVKEVKDYKLASSVSFLEIAGGNVCMSVLKRHKNGKGVVIRLYNMSGESSSAEIRCSREISGASEVNLDEEYQAEHPFNNNSVHARLGPWKVKTLQLVFSENNGE